MLSSLFRNCRISVLLHFTQESMGSLLFHVIRANRTSMVAFVIATVLLKLDGIQIVMISREITQSKGNFCHCASLEQT